MVTHFKDSFFSFQALSLIFSSPLSFLSHTPSISFPIVWIYSGLRKTDTMAGWHLSIKKVTNVLSKTLSGKVHALVDNYLWPWKLLSLPFRLSAVLRELKLSEAQHLWRVGHFGVNLANKFSNFQRFNSPISHLGSIHNKGSSSVPWHSWAIQLLKYCHFPIFYI